MNKKIFFVFISKAKEQHKEDNNEIVEIGKHRIGVIDLTVDDGDDYDDEKNRDKNKNKNKKQTENKKNIWGKLKGKLNNNKKELKKI
jgi:hypothetical protein